MNKKSIEKNRKVEFNQIYVKLTDSFQPTVFATVDISGVMCILD